MTFSLQLGSLGNLIGLDMLVIFGLQIAVIAGIVWLVVFLVRRSNPGNSKASVESRLAQLEQLQRIGAVSGTEYEEQRRRILEGI